MTKTYVDVHVLQSVPPSNINRDDTGSPKTALYGGVRRARVSSQSWKRATRNAFADEIDSTQLGVRTRKVVELVAQRIAELAPDLSADADKGATAALKETGLNIKEPRVKSSKTGEVLEPTATAGTSDYLVFLSRHQVDQLAQLAVAHLREGTPIDKKAAKLAADTRHSIDIALFGRMIADDKALNVDASTQVAHALSVHAADTEFDYFTAVDDLAGESEPGAGMIGTVEFTSSTLYRYASIDVGGLRHNLGDAVGETDAVARAVTSFVRAFVMSMPTGKQNTFANRTLPEAVVVTVRRGQPVNLVGAFEEAVQATVQRSRMAEAAQRLARYSKELDEAFGASATQTLVVRVSEASDALDELGERVSMDDLLARLADTVSAASAVPAA